jgi:hypothetical protein
MKIFDINTIREINEMYDYNLSDRILKEILNCLSDSKLVYEFDVIQEFEYYAN